MKLDATYRESIFLQKAYKAFSLENRVFQKEVQYSYTV